MRWPALPVTATPRFIGFFVGQCMKAMRGQGNPKIINELLAKKLAR